MNYYSINSTPDSKFLYEEALRMKSNNSAENNASNARDLNEKAELNKGR